jgi:hypothetical protein
MRAAPGTILGERLDFPLFLSAVPGHDDAYDVDPS